MYLRFIKQISISAHPLIVLTTIYYKILYCLVVLSEDYRGKKRGRALLKYAERWAAARNYTSFYLYCEESVKGFYQACGFEEDKLAVRFEEMVPMKRSF